MPEIWSVKKRKEIKARAKQLVWANIGRVMGIYVLFLLPMLLLALLTIAMAGGSILFSNPDILLNPSLASAELFVQRFANAALVAFLLLIFVGGPLYYGLQTFFIDLWQEKSPGVTALFTPFASLQSYWAGVRMIVCLLLRSLFWIVPAYLLSLAIESVALMAGWESMDSLSVQIATGQWFSVCVELVVMGIGLLLNLAASVKMRTFEVGYWLLDDQKDGSVTLVTDISSSLFHGHFKDTIVFVLSFAGWFILQGALAGLCTAISNAGGTLAMVLSGIAMLCLSLALVPFILAYSAVSFYGLFEALLQNDPVLKTRFHPLAASDDADDETDDPDITGTDDEEPEDTDSSPQSYYAADMRPEPEFPEETESPEMAQPTSPSMFPPPTRPLESAAPTGAGQPTLPASSVEPAETAAPTPSQEPKISPQEPSQTPPHPPDEN